MGHVPMTVLVAFFFLLALSTLGYVTTPGQTLNSTKPLVENTSFIDEPFEVTPLLDSQSLSSNKLSPSTNYELKTPIRILYLPITWENHPEDGYKTVECDIPCSYTGELSDNSVLTADAVVYHIPMYTGSPDGVLEKMGLNRNTVYTVATSMEPTGYYTSQFDDVSSFDIEMTFRLTSDIPLVYFGFSRDILQPIENHAWEQREPAVVFVASHCISRSRREKLVQMLQEFVRVDSVSKCLNNIEWPSDIPRSDKLSLLRRYMVYLAAENCIEQDYVTEKVYDGLITGAVPIYLGAPNFDQFVPPHSVITVPENFTRGDVQRVAETVQKIFTDKKEYEKWTAFKSRPYEDDFVSRFNFTRTEPRCRLCRKIFAHRHEGYYWDQQQQQIVTL